MAKRKTEGRRPAVVVAKSSATPGRLDLWMGLLLLVAVIAAYQPAWHGGFLYEDEMYARDNPLLTASGGLWRIWFTLESSSQYFPLTHSIESDLGTRTCPGETVFDSR